MIQDTLDVNINEIIFKMASFDKLSTNILETCPIQTKNYTSHQCLIVLKLGWHGPYFQHIGRFDHDLLPPQDKEMDSNDFAKL